jgi:hypothetical protein
MPLLPVLVDLQHKLMNKAMGIIHAVFTQEWRVLGLLFLDTVLVDGEGLSREAGDWGALVLTAALHLFLFPKSAAWVAPDGSGCDGVPAVAKAAVWVAERGGPVQQDARGADEVAPNHQDARGADDALAHLPPGSDPQTTGSCFHYWCPLQPITWRPLGLPEIFYRLAGRRAAVRLEGSLA